MGPYNKFFQTSDLISTWVAHKDNWSGDLTSIMAQSSEGTQRSHVASHIGLSKGSGSLTEDRHRIKEWIMSNGSWTFAAVLDGKFPSFVNPHTKAWWITVEFVVKELPQRLKDLLATELSQSPQLHLDDNLVARLLIKAVTEVDSRIADNFKSLLPENFGQIAAGDVVSALKGPASADGSPRVKVLVEHPNEEQCVITNGTGIITRALGCLILSRDSVLASTGRRSLIHACASIAASAQGKGQNMAVEILWQAFGGDGEGNLYGDELSRKNPDLYFLNMAGHGQRHLNMFKTSFN
ncbi:hypothetical protein BDP27DRAFT_1501690 [Rhodocollybia butyracea]|uniref:Uncharacterized protein n=1 Tax=Rhodocollybia butyracea TaxID=206335 RepID=A0A9P5TXB5_9AGAR|nr:hypothetical protein BDP27DRAFT_1501690 [Rhodocollybia butyracea]